MILRRMTATFGKLENETLELSAGMNIRTLPNESGKSTWAAFLTAMLYGIDTTERAKKGTLPVKTKYLPWSGHPMQGTLEVTCGGRSITIERTSEGRTPMGNFAAYDTDTGASIPELTAENCGKKLLGVEQSVFCRSAFIGQSAMALTPDAALEQRLSSLVTTGDESVSFTETEARLRMWKNHIRHNRTGLLPDAEERLRAVDEKLALLHRNHEENAALRARERTLTAQTECLRAMEKTLTARDAAAKAAELSAATEAAANEKAAAEAALEKAAALPAAETLTSLREDLSRIDAKRSLMIAAPAAEGTLPPPAEIPAFRGMTQEQAQAKSSQDAETLRAFAAAPKGRDKTLTILGAALLLVGVVLLFFVPIGGIAAAFAGFVLIALDYAARAKQTRADTARAVRAAQIMQDYGAENAEEISAAYLNFTLAQREYEQKKAAQAQTRAAAAAEREALTAQENALLTAVRAFHSDIYTLADAARALNEAQDAHRAAEKAADAAAEAAKRETALRAVLGDSIAVTAPADVAEIPAGYSLARAQAERKDAESALAAVVTELARHRGSLESLGDPAALEAERQELCERCDTLARREQALDAALAALRQADSELRARFAPQLNALAGEYMAKMTAGRYDRVRLEQDLSISAREAGADVSRSLLYLSGGTADELYLAVRLAICDLALGEDVPIVLDDALTAFDDTRLRAALEVLHQASAHRQILLFTCQSRELSCLTNEA